MQDRVVIPGSGAKGEMSRNDIRFDEPWATDLEDVGVPPGILRERMEAPDARAEGAPPALPTPRASSSSRTRTSRSSPTTRTFGGGLQPDPTHKLQSTGLAFLEKRDGENQGAFSAEAKRDYLMELKAQMDGQKADRRMEALKHWGWNVDPRRIRGGKSLKISTRTEAARELIDGQPPQGHRRVPAPELDDARGDRRVRAGD